MKVMVLVAVALGAGVGCHGKKSAAPDEQAAKSPTPAAAAKPDPVKVYRQLMARITDEVVAAMAEWAKTDFATQAEAFEALFDLTPASEKMQQRMGKAFVDSGLTVDQVTAFMADHPDIVDFEVGRMQGRLTGEMAKYESRMEALKKLPPGDMEGAQLRVARQMGKAGRTRQPDPPVLPDWTKVASLAELRTQAEAAAGQRQPVILHFRARWAAPTHAIEEQTFAAAGVRARLASYRRLFVDVSDGDEASDDLMSSLGVRAIPKVLVFTDPARLASFLAGDGALPAADVVFDSFVDPDAFLARLPR